jgi:hypothetical protein
MSAAPGARRYAREPFDRDARGVSDRVLRFLATALVRLFFRFAALTSG